MAQAHYIPTKFQRRGDSQKRIVVLNPRPVTYPRVRTARKPWERAIKLLSWFL